jgi:hypothetical protein
MTKKIGKCQGSKAVAVRPLADQDFNNPIQGYDVDRQSFEFNVCYVTCINEYCDSTDFFTHLTCIHVNGGDFNCGAETVICQKCRVVQRFSKCDCKPPDFIFAAGAAEFEEFCKPKIVRKTKYKKIS